VTASVLTAAIAVPAVTAAPSVAATKKTTITMSGSTSIFPLASALTKKYHQLNSKVSFRIAQGGSDKGITDAAKGRVTIGNSSRDPRSDDPKSTFNKIARDAVCLITNPSNKLANGLTQQQVQDIFSGKIRSWSEVPGAQQTGTISLQARNEASGTLDAFENLFMGGDSLSSTAARLASNGLIQAAVKRDPAAIGFVSIEFTAGVESALYGGVACTTANAKSGAYKGTRNLWMVTKDKPKGETARFIRWIQTSAAARKVIVAEKAVPLK
jgi:phosphate transport system substrate-binding protein